MESREAVNVDAYLRRIGVDRSELAVDERSLRDLQRQHLLSVPFENLDILWGTPITLDVGRFYNKIVERRRGGFCYELNGLFNELLRYKGFRTRIVSARVFNGTGYGPEFDHAAIIVTVGELEYLADVGFGDFAAEPLRLVPDIEQHDREGTFMLRRAEPGVLEVVKKNGDEWTPSYSFTLLGRDLSEFAEMCDFQQYSPKSHFTKGGMCSLMTDNGRKTLTNTKYIVTDEGIRTETSVNSAEEFEALLKREFGIERPI